MCLDVLHHASTALVMGSILFVSNTAVSTAPLDQQFPAGAGTPAIVTYLLQAAEGSLGVCDE